MPPALSSSQVDGLRQVVRENRAAYERTRDSRSGARAWDYIVVTAANQRQAKGYETQLAERRESGWLPAETSVMVVPDPGDQRVGSAGATFNVIRVIARDAIERFQAAHIQPADLGALFAKTRILVVHSGGDSKRIPHYSSYGKIFGTIPVRLPTGRTSTVFDEMLVSLAAVPGNMDEGLLVASGDVLLAFDPSAINFRWPGVTGIAIRSPADLGRRHGVYVPSPDRTHAHHFLQKPTIREMRSSGAVDAAGCVPVDSGLIRFDLSSLATLAGLAGCSLAGGRLSHCPSVLDDALASNEGIDLYDHILRPLAPATDRETYLGDAKSPAGRKIRCQIWEALRPLPLRVCALAPALMLHIGTTREFRQLVTTHSQAGDIYGFERCPNSHLEVKRVPSSAFIADSLVAGERITVGPRSVIENCELRGDVSVGRGAVAHGLRHLCPRNLDPDVVAHEVAVSVPGDYSLRALQGREGRVLRLYGVEDDPKTPAEDGGALFGEPIYEWLDSRKIPVEDIWPGVPSRERSLWNAKLYPMVVRTDGSATEDECFLVNSESATEESRKAWLKAERFSLAETFEFADCERMCEERNHTLQSVIESELAEQLPHDTDCEPVWRKADSIDLARGIASFVRDWAKRQEDPLLRTRAYKIISDILGSSHFRTMLPAASHQSLVTSHQSRTAAEPSDPCVPSSESRTPHSEFRVPVLPPRDEAMAWAVFESGPGDPRMCEVLADFYLKQSFDEVKEAVGIGLSRSVTAATAVIGHPSSVSGESPPSPRHPGRSVSVAVSRQPTTEDRQPGRFVTVTAPARIDFGGGWSDTPPYSLRNGGTVLNCAIRLDGEQPIRATVRAVDEPIIRLTSRDAEASQEYSEHAPLWQHSNPSDPLALLKAALCCVGLAPEDEPAVHGLELETATRLPQGSGLGTSSILAAAVAKALFEFVGHAAEQQELFSCVSYIEQMMSTGGGWQDQIGGAVPGLKLVTTQPGCEQAPSIQPLKLGTRACRGLQERMLLYYIGERRLASDILHAIMGNYISGDRLTVSILSETQRIAREMKVALEEGAIDQFGGLMWEHWELNKQLDPHTTNPRIETIIEMIRPMVSGLKMVGAGGGGFMEIVAKDASACRAISAALAALSQATSASVYSLEIDDAGLTVDGEPPHFG